MLETRQAGFRNVGNLADLPLAVGSALACCVCAATLEDELPAGSVLRQLRV